jgi:outer membrane protein TolC
LAIASAITNGWLQLNYLTGKPGEYRADLSELTGPSPTTSFMSQRAGLLERQEILAQRAVIRSREAGVEESRTGFYPEFFLKLGVDYTQNDRVVEQAIWSATLGFKVNLFDGHATSARQRQAVKLLAQEKERLQSMEAGIRLELQTARNDLTVASERISVTETAIKQSQENLRINTDRYQAQVGTATEVIDAQTLLSQARSDYYQALFDYQVALARVKRAAGEL